MKVLIAIAAAGAAATLALAPTASQARSLHRQHGASRLLSIATATAVALQPDGKIIAAGMNYEGDSTPPSWVVARFDPDGSRDRSFGNGGVVTTAFDLVSYATAVTLEPNGKVVVLGTSCDGGDEGACELALARYNGDGALDPSFGSGGKVTTRLAGFDVSGSGVAMQADGKIVAAGTVGSRTSDNYKFVVA